MRRHLRTTRRALLVAGVVAALLAVAPAAYAGKAVVGTFGTPTGEGNGELNEPRGIAINSTGVGGVDPGDVYVLDTGNNRVEEFSAAGAFVRAFGYDVVASGSDNTGVNEKQSVTVDATGGTFALAISRSTSAATTQGSNVVHVVAPTSAFHVGDAVQGLFPAGTTITAVGAESLVLSADATLSTSHGDFRATETTAPIPHNATAAELETALEALPSVGSGNIAVSGGPGATEPLTIEYRGALGHDDAFRIGSSGGQGQGGVIAAISTALSGATHTVTLATTVPGGGYEVCSASNPTDVCKGGPPCNRVESSPEACQESSSAGAMNDPAGIAIDQKTGDVYVVDLINNKYVTNNRVNVYSATGAFELSFGYDVVASGPDKLPPAILNERQKVTIPQPNGGTFTLSFNGQTSAPIPYNASASGLKAALEALPSIGAGNMDVSGPAGGPWLVEFVGTLAGASVSALSPDFANLFGSFTYGGIEVTQDGGPHTVFELCKVSAGDVCQAGEAGAAAGQLGRSVMSNPAVGPNGNLYVPDGANRRIEEFAPAINGSGEVTGVSFVKALGWDVVESGPDNVAAVDTVQQLTISSTAAAGSFTLSFNGQTTKALPYNVGKSALFTALNTLGSISNVHGSVQIVPKGTGVWELIFEGQFEDVPVPQVSVENSGGEATVSTLVEGVSPYEQCDVAANPTDVCKQGLAGGHLGQFSDGNPTSVAVDSSGAIYAVNQVQVGTCLIQEPCRVLKFGPSGDTSEEFAPSWLSPPFLSEAEAVTDTDIAIDPASGHVLVAKKEGEEGFKFLEFDSSGALLDESPAAGQALQASLSVSGHGLAIGAGGRFYFTNPLGMIDVFGPPPAATVSIAKVTDVGATTATFKGTVTPPAPIAGKHFDTTYHFEYSTDGSHWSRFPAEEVDAGNGSGAGDPNSCPLENPSTCNVSQAATGLEPSSRYQVRLVATTGTPATSSSESFETEPAPPAASGARAEEVAQTSVTLAGVVNPDNQATTYSFEWGPSTAYGNQTELASAGSGGEPENVSVVLSDLQAGVLYHYRLRASNASGAGESLDGEFTALDSFSLPDDRAPEQVSPADKRPAGWIADLVANQIVAQVSNDGNSTLYSMLNGLANSTAGGNVEYLGQRGDPGWGSTQISAPSVVPATTTKGDQPSHVLYYSPDLSCGLISSETRLTADTPSEDLEAGVINLYRRNSDGSYALVSIPVPLNRPDFVYTNEPAYTVQGASSDCSHILFSTEYQFEKEAPSGTQLYEWADGTLLLAGVRPDGSVAPNAEAGGPASRNPISTDGSHVFFTATSDQGGDKAHTAVFVRENGTEAGTKTLDASQSQTATPNDSAANYQMASTDGSHVFFTARYGLASNATSAGANACSNGQGCDLYSYDVNTETLTDLSADANAADGAGASVAGLLDVSEDGSYAYFAARGQLVPGQGRTETQNISRGEDNVYLSHDGSLSYVAPVRQSDMAAQLEGADGAANPLVWAADATPDGTHLLFVSKANVTGYESGGVLEAYVYSVSSGHTICVSCRMDGKAATKGSGGFDEVEPVATETQHESLNDVMEVKPRSISDDGRRVFFKMHDALAPGAIPSQRNFYEWENGQVYLLIPGEGGGEGDLSEYFGASASGNDVFMRTTSKLVPQDSDNTTDVYDFRAPHVAGESVGPEAVVPSPQPCNPLAGECQSEVLLQPAPGAAIASEFFSGPGNPRLALKEPARKKPAKKKPAKKNRHSKKKAGKRKPGKDKPSHRKKAHKPLRKRATDNKGRDGR